jgi:XTP/dITP diphosphohydrolase
MPSLVVASGNAGKIRELTDFFETLSPLDGIPTWTLEPKPEHLDPEETGSTFAENAAQKAVGIAKATQKWAIADDSGLCVQALGGRPGVYSARYAPTDAERIEKLLAELEQVLQEQGLDPQMMSLRTAWFECAIALSDPDGVVRCAVTGSCWGQIALAPAGSGGFGYDPIFWVPDVEQTFAQMDPATKAQISHRGQALTALRQALAQGLRAD